MLLFPITILGASELIVATSLGIIIVAVASGAEFFVSSSRNFCISLPDVNGASIMKKTVSARSGIHLRVMMMMMMMSRVNVIAGNCQSCHPGSPTCVLL